MEIRDKRGREWFWIQNETVDKYGKVLGPYGVAVYIALARYANNETQSAIPSVKTLGEKVGVSSNKTREILHQLKELGLVEISPRYSPEGDQTSNAYILLNAHGVVGVPHTVEEGPAPDVRGVPHTVGSNNTHNEQDLIEPDTIVHAPTNGDARTKDIEWPNEFADVKKELVKLDILFSFNDPAYWKAIETWTDTCGFPIYYLDELRAYHAYQIALAPGARHKHKDLKKGFRTWIANAINFRRRDAERKASWQRR